jgi:hypothetical protein
MIQIKLVGMFMISYYTNVRLPNYKRFMSCLHKTNYEFNIQTAASSYFFVSDKNGLIKSCSSFEDLSVYKTSWSYVDWCKFCIHLRSSNGRHFVMVEGTGSESTASRSSSMA